MAYSFDFTGGSLPTGATLARSTTGYRVNASGLLVPEAINAPRLDYDPVSLAFKGLLLEPSQTNLLLQSENTGTTWVPSTSGVTTAQNSATAPDGNVTADTISDALSGNFTNISQSVTVPTTNLKYWLSVFVKKTGVITNTFGMDLAVGGGSGALDNQVYLNTNSGLSAGSNQMVEDYANYWRFSASLQSLNGGTGLQALLYSAISNNVGSAAGSAAQVSGVGDAIIWGMNVTTGAAPGSYIQTTTAAASRGVETLSLNWGAQGIPDGACFHRVTFDDLSTQLLAGAVASGVATIAGGSLTRPRVRKVDYILSPRPAPGRTLTLADNFA